MGYHMFRDLEQNAPLKDAVTQAGLKPVAWVNQSAMLDRDISKKDWVHDPPFDCDPVKLAKWIEDNIPDDADIGYLDLESPMVYPFNARSKRCYEDAIGAAKFIRPRMEWGVYSMVHRPLSWRTPGVPWKHWLNGIYPLCDFACPSLYPRSGKWTDDLLERWSIDNAHADAILNDQGAFPQLAFVRPNWKSNGGDGQMVPLDWWIIWLRRLDRRGVPVCLFMDKHEQEDMIEFVPYIQAVGALKAEVGTR